MRFGIGETLRLPGAATTAVCGVLIAGTLAICPAPAAADPGVSEPITEVGSVRWDGPAATADLGQNTLANAGDVNEDGRDDLLVSSDTPSSQRGVFVLFTGPAMDPSPDLTNLEPSAGYQVLTLSDSSPSAVGVGDQNGDGAADMLVQTASGTAVAVVYGVSDPSTLPACPTNSGVRCLNTATLTTSQGYQLVGHAQDANFGGDLANAGDFNGDQINDLLISAPNSNVTAPNAGAVYVVYGGRTASATPFDVSAAPPAEVLRISGRGENASLGVIVNGVGDLNDDGLADVATLSADDLFLVYGSQSAASPIDLAAFPTAAGFVIDLPPLAGSVPVAVGDIDGDGRDDLALVGTGTLVDPDGAAYVVYAPDSPPAESIAIPGLTPEEGFALARAESGSDAQFGGSFAAGTGAANLGDLNGDGWADLLVAAPGTAIAGLADAGAADVVFGQGPTPAAAVFDSTLTPDRGFALTGSAAGGDLGYNVAALGDVDDDGLSDAAVSGPDLVNNALSSSGSVYLITGASLIANAATGDASEVTQTTASIAGDADPNGRDSTVYFEWGTSEDYGNRTEEQEVSGADSIAVGAELSGLEPATTYHYRIVVENDLGLTRYGADASFTTQAPPDSDGDGVPDASDRCPSQAGPASNDGCPQAPPPGEAELAMTAKGKNAKAGKKAKLTATVRNIGNAAASGVRVCVKAPKRKARLKGACKSIGELAAGAHSTAKFKPKVAKQAKQGSRVGFRFTATGEGLAPATASLKVKVK